MTLQVHIVGFNLLNKICAVNKIMFPRHRIYSLLYFGLSKIKLFHFYFDIILFKFHFFSLSTIRVMTILLNKYYSSAYVLFKTCLNIYCVFFFFKQKAR